MKNDSVTEGQVGFVVRLLTVFLLLMVGSGANAVDCLTLYAQSGATPGSKTCRLDVVGNTPGGMGNYACINDLALIDQWCSVPADPDESCPVADPVYPANGKVSLVENDFRSGDAVPLTFTRSYLNRPTRRSAQCSMLNFSGATTTLILVSTNVRTANPSRSVAVK